MECSEVKEHLPAYFDGELPADLADTVKTALSNCPDCQQELEELTLLSELARDGFTAPVESVDFSQLPDQVMARIKAEQSESAVEGIKVEQTKEEAPGLLDTIADFFGELLRFERPMAAVAAAALVVLMVVGLQKSGEVEDPTQGSEAPAVANKKDKGAPTQNLAKNNETGPDEATTQPTPAPKAIAKKNRRQRAMEEHAGSRDMAAIESSRAPAGVRIDIDQDQGRPAIVWHVDEDTEDAPN
jgi:negative regulator of sigma E activity